MLSVIKILELNKGVYMLRIPLMIVIVSMFASCSSKQTVKTNLEDEAIERAAREDVVIGKPLPSWVNESGIDGEFIYAVGSAEFPLDKSEHYVVSAATFDARGKVLQDAPSDYKAIVQKAIGDSLGTHGDFNQIQVSVSEVKGVAGIKVDNKKVTCRKIKRYKTSGTKLNRICYAYAYAPITKVNEAYARVFKDKYGVSKSNRFKEILDNQVKSVFK